MDRCSSRPCRPLAASAAAVVMCWIALPPRNRSPPGVGAVRPNPEAQPVPSRTDVDLSLASAGVLHQPLREPAGHVGLAAELYRHVGVAVLPLLEQRGGDICSTRQAEEVDLTQC